MRPLCFDTTLDTLSIEVQGRTIALLTHAVDGRYTHTGTYASTSPNGYLGLEIQRELSTLVGLISAFLKSNVNILIACFPVILYEYH